MGFDHDDYLERSREMWEGDGYFHCEHCGKKSDFDECETDEEDELECPHCGEITYI